MKEVIIFLFIIILLVFSIPFLFTNSNFVEVSSNTSDETEVLDNSKYSTIRLFHSLDESIETLNMNEYLYGVVASEMPANFELEALKAQAVVARTYVIYKIENGSKHENADICDSSLCCQAWMSKENRMSRWEEKDRENNWNKILKAVNETNGKYITYNGKPINAFFHSNSGGKTELASNVWGANLPYLQIVETNGEENYNAYKSEVKFSKDEFIVKMRENYNDFVIDFKKEEPIKILDYTESGRVKFIQIGNKKISGIEARKILGLKSNMFSVKIESDYVIFSVRGYGHGVGLSQTGSDILAKNGYNFEEIINYYFKNVEIVE